MGRSYGGHMTRDQAAFSLGEVLVGDLQRGDLGVPLGDQRIAGGQRCGEGRLSLRDDDLPGRDLTAEAFVLGEDRGQTHTSSYRE